MVDFPLNPEFPYYLAEADLVELVERADERKQADWDLFLSFAEPRDVAAGGTVIQQRDTEAAVYILTQGRLEVLIETPDRSATHRVAVVEPIAIIGEHGFLDGGPRTASLVATTSATVHRLSRTAFDQLRLARPDIACAFMFDVARTLSQRTRATAP